MPEGTKKNIINRLEEKALSFFDQSGFIYKGKIILRH
jgi:hypothetical protein